MAPELVAKIGDLVGGLQVEESRIQWWTLSLQAPGFNPRTYPGFSNFAFTWVNLRRYNSVEAGQRALAAAKAENVVGLYKLNPVDPSRLKAPGGFNP